MQQKIIKVGNSYAVTIPKQFIDTQAISVGDVVSISQQPQKKRIIVDFQSDEVTEDVIDKEVYKIGKQLLKRYLPAFKELAKK
jgi:putative addiction module antidote